MACLAWNTLWKQTHEPLTISYENLSTLNEYTKGGEFETLCLKEMPFSSGYTKVSRPLHKLKHAAGSSGPEVWKGPITKLVGKEGVMLRQWVQKKTTGNSPHFKLFLAFRWNNDQASAINTESGWFQSDVNVILIDKSSSKFSCLWLYTVYYFI